MISKTVAETIRFAGSVAKKLRAGDVVALVGPLGAGKTCFVQGLALGLGVPRHTQVNSPTFIVLNIYKGRLPLYHFDWYRLQSGDDLDGLGLEEYFDGDGVTVVEWADKFPGALPERTKWIKIEMGCRSGRRITIT